MQTLSYFGISKNELIQFLQQYSLFGFDRVVPVGSTLEFSLNWDGFDLIKVLTRKIDLI